MTALPAGVMTHKIAGKKLTILYPSITGPHVLSLQKINTDILNNVQNQIRFGGYDGECKPTCRAPMNLRRMSGTFKLNAAELCVQRRRSWHVFSKRADIRYPDRQEV
ncbi:hypothetical protein MGI18_16325 [Bacillus sp. OVS6]|nr:hypothetical protein MGI18_16325 [Bacillus sp. OVS6]